MSKSTFLLIFLLIITISFTTWFIVAPPKIIPNNNSKPPLVMITPIEKMGKFVDYRASFTVYTVGLKRSFSASMYHNRSDEVYILADNPNIIYIKVRGTTWGDFFETLPMKLTNQCLTTGTDEEFCNGGINSLKFYVNEVALPDFLNTEIQNGDRALIVYGSETEEQISNLMKQVGYPIPSN